MPPSPLSALLFALRAAVHAAAAVVAIADLALAVVFIDTKSAAASAIVNVVADSDPALLPRLERFPPV